MYKGRARIEQAFGSPKRFKRVALHCEKTAKSFAKDRLNGPRFILLKSVQTAWHPTDPGLTFDPNHPMGADQSAPLITPRLRGVLLALTPWSISFKINSISARLCSSKLRPGSKIA